MDRTTYDDHPIAAIFPLMGEDELRDLAADIEANGLREPVRLYEGKVLDGRNRYRACRLAGTDPRCEEYAGPDPLGFVVSMNLHRRHLTESQRAMVAAKIANVAHGGDRKSDQEANLPLDIPHVSQAKAAELLNVSERTVKAAKAVHKNGVPDLVRAVEAGEVTVSAAAEVARLPKKEQKKAVREKAVKAKAKQVREKAAEPTQPKDVADPDEFVALVETLCRDIDQITRRVEALKFSPFAHSIHWQSAADQVSAARRALWVGRPAHACPYCEKAGDVKRDCAACKGTGRVRKDARDRGLVAVGGDE